MTNDAKIEAALRIAERYENHEIARLQKPDREVLTHHQKAKEREGDSSWSGGSAGGGVWAGRRER